LSTIWVRTKLPIETPDAKALSCLHGCPDAAEYRDAVPGFLAVPDRLVAGVLDGSDGEALVRRLQLLKADDIRKRLFEPA
jgi:hypothetical protein